MDTFESGAPRAPAPPRVLPAGRLHWLDGLRVALTVLVIVHHAAQPYGPADWWYVEDQPRTEPLGTLSAVDGSFFMSLFFFVSAVFMPGSYERRGAWAFVKGRLIRLGIPVVVGALTLVPGLLYAYYVNYRGHTPVSFPRYFTEIYLGLGEKPAGWSGPSWPDLQFGHLWFIQNLLAYSVLYVLCRQAGRLLRWRPGDGRSREPGDAGDAGDAGPVPGHGALFALTVVIAAATFLVRLRHPLDSWIPVLDFLQVEPARLPQYTAFLVLGVLAHRYDWLTRFDARTGWVWLAGGSTGVVVLFVVGADADCFGPGGPDVPSALWAAYESALCVALCAGLLTLFREKLTGRSQLSVRLAADSYAVYIIHLPLVVMLQYLLAGRGLGATGAWGAVSLVAVPVSFLLAAGLRRLPGLRKVL